MLKTKKIKRIVIKVGTSTVTHATGKINISKIEALTREISNLVNQGLEVMLVSSGAVGAGIGKLGWQHYPKYLPDKQAAASIGQGVLLHMYEKLFSEYGIIVGQILLTSEDFSYRKRYLNARNTMFALLRYGIVPIINENDTIAVEEIKFGDNDTLSAKVAALVDADLLILLSDIDGLYDCNPNNNPEAKLITYVDKITPEIENYAEGAGSKYAVGGMSTKLQAAKIAMYSGVSMVIANGNDPRIIHDIIKSKAICTYFDSKESKLEAKKSWLSFGSHSLGKIIVDLCATEKIVSHGKSLLAVGIKDVSGSFEIGDVVSLVSEEGKEFARGISNYSFEAISKIKGKPSNEIDKILGYKDYDEVIHRDNLSLKI